MTLTSGMDQMTTPKPRTPPTSEQLAYAKEMGWLVHGNVGEFTCHNCAQATTCRSAWDLYNTNDECLEDK